MIHIVGFPVQVGHHFVQRCAWCGEVIEDVDLSLVAISPNADGSTGSGWMPWPIGELIDICEGSRSVIAHKDGDPIPIGCCAFRRHLTVVPTGGE